MLPAGIIKHIHNGNGTTRNFDFTFPIFTTDGSDIKLYKMAIGGTVTEITSNYYVDVAGAYVTYPTIASELPLLVTGEKIILLREEELSQLIDWRNKGPFNAETAEGGLDKVTAILQQLSEELSRCLKIGVSYEGDSEEAEEAKGYAEAAQTAQGLAQDAQAAAEAALAAAEEAIASIPPVDTDGTLAENSDSRIATQKATKTYADTKANKGANSDITSLSGLTTPLSVAQGGTGATTAADARTNLGVPAATALGAWVDKSADYAAQQATTDGFVVGFGTSVAADDSKVVLYTDANADPTTIRQHLYPSPYRIDNFCMPVKKNDYWKAVKTIGNLTFVIYWIPLGS